MTQNTTSKTKSTVKRQQINEIFSYHFPASEISYIEELTEGLFNRAYAIYGTNELINGVVIKIGTQPGTKVLTNEINIMHTEISVYSLLKNLTIPIPKVYVSDTSKTIINCDYIIMERINGITWKSIKNNLDETTKESLLYELGHLTASFHSIKGNYFGYINRPHQINHLTWSSAFSMIVNDAINDSKYFGFELPLNSIKNAINKHLHLLDEIVEPSLVNNDLYGNIILSKDSRKIVGVVDFERCYFADPFVDFISSSMLFEDVETAYSFKRGYESFTEQPLLITENDSIRMNLYRLLKALIQYNESHRYEEEFKIQIQTYMRMKIHKYLDLL